ncbi:MAG: hypothetical protein KDB14_25005, partial [Planctomycetales bacterium]|nr:hypothetical protein [Planctomycetales bacterium]
GLLEAAFQTGRQPAVRALARGLLEAAFQTGRQPAVRAQAPRVAERQRDRQPALRVAEHQTGRRRAEFGQSRCWRTPTLRKKHNSPLMRISRVIANP